MVMVGDRSASFSACARVMVFSGNSFFSVFQIFW